MLIAARAFSEARIALSCNLCALVGRVNLDESLPCHSLPARESAVLSGGDSSSEWTVLSCKSVSGCQWMLFL